jgi:hypothetical protein
MNLPPMNMKLFYGLGVLAFLTQASSSATIFFINMKTHYWFTALATWLMIAFSLAIAYLFFYLYMQEGLEFDVNELLKEARR